MKFLSRISNLRVVLSPGIPGNSVLGTPAKSGLYVRFEHGSVNVEDPEIAKKMMAHPSFENDFVVADETEIDPYLARRKDKEPQHVVTEMDHGQPKRVSNADKIPGEMSPDMKIAVNEMAIKLAKEIAKDIVPGMAKEMVKDMLSKTSAASKSPAKKKTTKAKVIKEEVTEDKNVTEDTTIENSEI